MNLLEKFRERAAPFRDVLGFSFGHWRNQRAVVTLISICMIVMTMADVLLPVYVGKLIDALAPAVSGGDRSIALHEAIWALGWMIGLGLLMLVTRHVAFVAGYAPSYQQCVYAPPPALDEFGNPLPPEDVDPGANPLERAGQALRDFFRGDPAKQAPPQDPAQPQPAPAPAQ